MLITIKTRRKINIKKSKLLLYVFIITLSLIVITGCRGGSQPDTTSKVTEAKTETPSKTSDDVKWPERPLKFVVSIAAGGGTDRQFRALAQYLQPVLGVPISVENKPGADTREAITYVFNHPDAKEGYMFLASVSPAAVRGIYDITKTKDSFEPIVTISTVMQLLVVHKNSSIKSFEDFVAVINKKGGTFRLGDPGGGSGQIWKKFTEESKLPIRNLPYQGTPALLAAALDDRDDAYIQTYANLSSYIKSGELRPIAVLGPDPIEALPDVPIITEVARKAGLNISDPDVVRKMLLGHGDLKNNPAIVNKMEAAIKALFRPDSDYIKHVMTTADGPEMVFQGREKARKNFNTYFDKIANE